VAATVAIPLVTLTAGVHNFGPAAVPDADSLIVLTLDRTVTQGGTQGLNGQPDTTTITMETGQSGDGGLTWQVLALATIAGGSVISPKTGLLITSNELDTRLNPGTGRQVRAQVTVAGADVAVAGSLATS
jgi:hypothetical protein